MKINITDTAKLQAALDAVNGKAKAFTLGVVEVRQAAEEADYRLAASGVPKGERQGATVRYSPAGAESGAYKWTSRSTRVFLLRGASSWYLTGCHAVEVYPRQKEVLSISLTPDAHAAHVARQSALFGITL